VPAYRLNDFVLLDAPPGRFRHCFLTLGPYAVGELSQETGRGPRFSFKTPQLREAFAKAHAIEDQKGWARIGIHLLEEAEKALVLQKANRRIRQTAQQLKEDAKRWLISLENTDGGLEWFVHDVAYSKREATRIRKERDVVLILNEDPNLRKLRS
jgi:hypothetical protein